VKQSSADLDLMPQHLAVLGLDEPHSMPIAWRSSYLGVDMTMANETLRYGLFIRDSRNASHQDRASFSKGTPQSSSSDAEHEDISLFLSV